MAHPLDGPCAYVLIDENDETAEVNELTLLDSFSAWDCWMSFMRLLTLNQPATMCAYFDDADKATYRVIKLADLNDRCTFENPHGKTDEQT